jgi:hypothetical protein
VEGKGNQCSCAKYVEALNTPFSPPIQCSGRREKSCFTLTSAKSVEYFIAQLYYKSSPCRILKVNELSIHLLHIHVGNESQTPTSPEEIWVTQPLLPSPNPTKDNSEKLCDHEIYEIGDYARARPWYYDDCGKSHQDIHVSAAFARAVSNVFNCLRILESSTPSLGR